MPVADLTDLTDMTEDETREYLQGLKPGERVIETEQSCMYGKLGTVYISQNEATKGSICAMWEGGMGTSVTWGTDTDHEETTQRTSENTMPLMTLEEYKACVAGAADDLVGNLDPNDERTLEAQFMAEMHDIENENIDNGPGESFLDHHNLGVF